MVSNSVGDIKGSPTIVALVPMRDFSERVPGKNYRAFAGSPLYHHIIKSLLACPLVGQVVIDTDSPTILDDAEHIFPEVRLLARPEHLRDGSTPMNEVLLHDVSQVDGDYYLQTHCTNPLLRTDTISSAIEEFLEQHPKNDSLFGVTRVQTRFWDEMVRPMNHDPAVLLRTQDLPPVYEENSNLYIFTRDLLERRRTRIGERPLPFVVDRLEALDIDEELDFRIAEFLYLERQKPS